MSKGKIFSGSVIGLLVLCLLIFQNPVRADGPQFLGSWEGRLEFSGSSLRIVFNIDESPDGLYQATMDSPDQGAEGIPTSALEFEGDQGDLISIEIGVIQGSFKGKISPDGGEIDGVWSQGQANIPLKLKKVAEAGAQKTNNRPQEPQPPFPYRESEVVYQNESAGVELAGTLTTPRGEGPFPAVVLISGSGSQDRDEKIMGHKPFLVIADYLTREGIAVLRFDDRGVGGSTGDPMTATSADLMGDVLAGVDFLKNHPEINFEQIGLIGHSEGGLIAPMAAVQSEDISFIILLAGTGIPGDRLLELQVEAILRAGGKSEEEIKEQVKQQSEIGKIVKNIEDDQEAAERLRPILRSAAEELGETDRSRIINSYGSLENYYEKTIETFLLPWYRYFIAYDPRPTLRQVRCPVLAINGSNDTQVDAGVNLTEIEGALKDGGNTDVTIRELPGLNHLFQHSVTGSPDEYGAIEETISPDVLQLIGSWIVERVER